MKRHGHLWENVISFEAFLRAADRARRGKRFRPAVASFHFDLEHELWALHEELSTKRYRPGAYRTFFICEPKPRQISAAPYRDRVVHHALVNVLEPIYERTFIHDSYACRQGKGTHAAVDRCQHFARRFRYVLKADIQKFFPSLDHQILKAIVARKVKDPDVLWLLPRQQSYSHNRRGIPHLRVVEGGGKSCLTFRPAWFSGATSRLNVWPGRPIDTAG
jgi:retron-type reverse transcriptase